MGTSSIWALCLATISVAAAGSVLPFSPIEPYLLALSTVAPREWIIPLALLATASHMVGKALLYWASRRAAGVIPSRYQPHVDGTSKRLRASVPLRYATMLASGMVGVPPFYLVTVLAGTLRVSLAEFLLIGTVGRAVRFIALAALPQLAR